MIESIAIFVFGIIVGFLAVRLTYYRKQTNRETSAPVGNAGK